MLFCNRVGHQQKEITSCCTKKTCTQGAACCQICMHEYHSANHQIPDFIFLDNIMKDDWLSPIITNVQGTLDQLLKNFTLFHQGIQDLINKANIYQKYKQEPNLVNLNNLCQINKCQDVISIQLNNVNQQLQQMNLNINDQFYKSLKLIAKVSPIYRIVTEEHNQNDKGFIKSHLLFIEKRFKEVHKVFELNKKVDFTLRHQINKAITYLKLRQPKNSLQLIEHLYQQYPQNLKVISKKCFILGEIRPQQALEFIEQDTKLHSQQKIIKKALLLQKINNLNDAIHQIEQAIKNDPNNDKLYRIQAYLLNQNKYPTQAIQCLDQAITLNSKNPENYLSKATILNNQMKKQEALQSIDKAIDLQPCNPWNYLFKAEMQQSQSFPSQIMSQIQFQFDKTEDTIQLCEKAINLEYSNIKVRLAYAQLLQNMMNYDKAIKQYDEAMTIDPSQIEILLGKAKLLQAINRNTESIELLNQAITLNPGDHQLCQLKVDAYLKMNQYVEANSCCDEFLKLTPNEYQLYALKAYCVTKMDKLDLAVTYYDYAIELYQDICLYIAKILVLCAKKDITTACQEFVKAEKLDPNNEDIINLKNLLLELKKSKNQDKSKGIANNRIDKLKNKVCLIQ